MSTLTVDDLNINGDLQFGGASGTANQTLRSFSGSPTWISTATAYGYVNLFMNAQDYNALPAGNALSFDTFTESNFVSGTPNIYTPFEVFGAFELICNTDSVYRIDFNIALVGYSAQVAVRAQINGVTQGPAMYSTVVTNPGEISLVRGYMILPILATQRLSFVSNRVSGTNSLVSLTDDSYIMVSLLHTVG